MVNAKVAAPPVSWLLQGEIVHKDSLGNEALLRPRGVNVMTSGGGIAHSEETPPKNSGFLKGVQLWIAARCLSAWSSVFSAHWRIPIIEQAGGTVPHSSGSPHQTQPVET